jgi:hypothetical protein
MNRRLQLSLRLSALPLSLSLSACSRLSADCIALGRPAITFTLRDAASNARLATGATVTLVGGVFADTVQVPPGQAASGIGLEREGAMQLAIDAPGFARWERALTVRRAGACDYLQTVDLNIRL